MQAVRRVRPKGDHPGVLGAVRLLEDTREVLAEGPGARRREDDRVGH